MQANDIAKRLAERAESVCKMLLFDGKRKGHRWFSGNTSGCKGESLVVELDGEKVGIWCDFETGQGGDLLDLWRECKNLTMAETLAQVRGWLGISENDFHPKREKNFQRPELPKCTKPALDETSGDMSAVMDYLVMQRKLEPETVKRFQIREENDAIIFPYFRDSELIHIKHLAIRRDANGKKKMWASKNTAPILFGWQAMPEHARAVCITAGEIDAMTLSQMGAHALSIPMGDNNDQWIELEYGRLERFDEIFIAFDSDESGQKAALKVIERLGNHRCRLIQWPNGIKDANDALMQGWDQQRFADCILTARSIDPKELRNAADYLDCVLSEFYPPAGKQIGVRMPWEKVGDKILFRPAEVTLWTGINGHGKSLLLGQQILHAIFQGERACIASMEMPPRRTLYRIVRQAAALEKPSDGYIAEVIQWLGSSLWLFDVIGTAKTQTLLDVFAYARRRYGITQFVVDSLAKCGIAEDDYTGQKRFVEMLTDFAHEHDIHLHLVAHSRKGQNEYTAPGKMDVRGSAGITDMVDNVITVWRNKRKEECIKANLTEDEEDPMILERPDAAAIVTKQRHTGWEDKIWLWFEPESLQFLPKDGAKPTRYVGYRERKVA